MRIDWTHFTPGSALAGGLLIGLAAGLYVLASGRIAGISGLLASLLRPPRAWAGEKALFLLGMVVAPLLWQLGAALPPAEIRAGAPLLALAGLLVGLGTRYGAGCTSGHGVCGLARLSPRSLVATACFMATGFLTVFTVRHLLPGVLR
ncbi:MAG: YeeE/YedE family protein [Synechococcaceae cyanobacterium]|nr:YeeE/YedE family protein [Synechococcaceae cyanobacterium]